MRWAIIAHPDQYINGRLVQTPRLVPEDALPVAVAQEWIVLARDSQVEPVHTDANLQSNPRRPHGYGAVEENDGA